MPVTQPWLSPTDRRQLVLPVTSTIFAGRYGVIIRYGGAVDFCGRSSSHFGSRSAGQRLLVVSVVGEAHLHLDGLALIGIYQGVGRTSGVLDVRVRTTVVPYPLVAVGDVGQPVSVRDVRGVRGVRRQRLPHQDIAALQDRLTRLSQASLNINESLDLDDVFRKVLDSARSLTGARYGVITTINDAGHKNAFLSRLSSPMRVDDFQSHTRSLGMPEFTPLLPVRAFLGAPIRYRGASMGHIYLAKPDGVPEFTQEDEETLAMFASHAALAIANARRYRDEQRARNDLEALVNLSPMGVLVFDARTGDLLMVNEEARRIGGGQHKPVDYIQELLRSVCHFSPTLTQ